MSDQAFQEAERREVFEDADITEGVTRLKNYVYAHVGNRPLLCDLYYKDKRPDAPRPAIVLLHGGCWLFGNQTQFVRQASYWADTLNLFAMSVDYRLSEEAPFPAALQDAKCAVRWVRAHAAEYHIDPDQVIIAGGSAGGHLAAMLATSRDVPAYEGDNGYADFPSHANAAVLLNGEFDLWDLLEKNSLLDAMVTFLGGTAEEIPERYNEASPIRRVDETTCPMLFLHGDQDTCVSHEQAVAMHEKLRAVGVHSELEIYRNKPHAWFNSPDEWKPVAQRIERFIREQVA